MGLLLRIKKPLLTGATQRAHRRAQPLPSGLSPSAPESNRFGRARALFAGLSAHGPHHRRCGISPPPEAAYSIPTSCQNSNMQNPASIKGAAAWETAGSIRPGAALAGPGRGSALAAALRRTRRGPNGRPARKGGEIAAPRSSSGGNAPANMPPAPFPHPPLPGGGFLSAAQSPPRPAPPSCAGAAPIAALSFPGGLCRPKRNRTLSRRWREKRPAFLVSVCCGAPQPPAAIKPGPWPPGSPWYP